jgi:hypothetical protein
MNCFLCTDSNASITTQTNLYAQTVDSSSNVDCSVCGIYRITGTATALIKNNPEIVGKIRRWLWEQHHFHGVQRPQIDEYRLDTLKNQPNLTVGEMKDRFLQALYFLNQKEVSKHHLLIYSVIPITENEVSGFICSALGIPWATYTALISLADDFRQKGFVSFEGPAERPLEFQLTLDGLEYAENSLKKQSNSQRVFIAMPFGDDKTEKEHFNNVYNAIKSSIESNGLTSYRIDDDHHIDRIDSKILSEIQNSRAVVVDLTCSNKKTEPPFGEKGGELKRCIPNANVYFEAGYAYALGKPVFYICNQKDFGNRAFDLATFNCLQYQETPEGLTDLQSELRNRLKEVLKIPNES